MGKVIVITSGKGGTGKTLFTANMGAILAMQGKKVALIDLDIGLRNLDLYLGLESKVVYNVVDVLSGVCKIKQALVKDRRFEEMYLIGAAPNIDDRDITPLHMEVLCEKLKKEFDYVIIDSPAGIGEGFDLAVAGADIGIIVTEAEMASIRDADSVDRKLVENGIKERFCIINKVNAELMALGIVPTVSEIGGMLRAEMAGVVQYDDNMFIATNKGVPIVLKQGTYIEKNLSKIVNKIVG